jgi:hypothetical protein
METLVVRNDEAVGSIPTSSTIFSSTYRRSANHACHTLSQYSSQGLPKVCLKQLRSSTLASLKPHRPATNNIALSDFASTKPTANGDTLKMSLDKSEGPALTFDLPQD